MSPIMIFDSGAAAAGASTPTESGGGGGGSSEQQETTRQQLQLRYALGTPGSFGIPQTTTQLIMNCLDFGTYLLRISFVFKTG